MFLNVSVQCISNINKSKIGTDGERVAWHMQILSFNYKVCMGLRQDSICPLCQEEEDTTAHCSVQCSSASPEEHSWRLHSFFRYVK